MKVVLSVFNNLYTDQRVEKVCETLHNNGFEVHLIGNSWDGLPEISRPYQFTRIKLSSKSLKLAYPEFNLKLYSKLKEVCDNNTILVSNDLDVLLANYLISKKLDIPLLYDSHEIYTEMPSVQGRFVQKIWRFLEKKIIPNIKYMITASESYADWFQKRYSIPKPTVIQNFPRRRKPDLPSIKENSPKIIIYQGAVNPSRGIDKMISAISLIENSEFWIVGNGPKLKDYQALVQELKLENKVKFLGKILPEKLREITSKADVGISIEENNGLSYYFSLPNKISDYIQAKIPIVVSNFPEMKKIIETYNVGQMIENHTPEEISKKINLILQNRNSYAENLEIAASQLSWENEEPKLLSIFEKVVKENFKNS